jgi:hypothetical protein
MELRESVFGFLSDEERTLQCQGRQLRQRWIVEGKGA